MKFTKEKRSHLLGHTEVVFTEVSEKEKPFTMTADQTGVHFQGFSTTIENRGQLDEFAKALSDAWEAHREQIPVIVPATQIPLF